MSRANLAARARTRPDLRVLIICSKHGKASDKASRAPRAATTSTSSAGRLLGPVAMFSSSSRALKRSLVTAFGSRATLLTFLTTARRSARSAALIRGLYGMTFASVGLLRFPNNRAPRSTRAAGSEARRSGDRCRKGKPRPRLSHRSAFGCLRHVQHPARALDPICARTSHASMARSQCGTT
jgi:hypothetical protein